MNPDTKRRDSNSVDVGARTGRKLLAVGLAAVVVASVVTGALAGSVTAAEQGTIASAEILNVEDRDGDGWASSFQVEVTANSDFPEQGGVGASEPYFAIYAELANGDMHPLVGKKIAREDGSWVVQVDSDEVFDRAAGKVLILPRFQRVEVQLRDDDSGASWLPGILGVGDVTSVDSKQISIDGELPFERANNDVAADVEVTSNVEGATVSVDGREIGETPTTFSAPVDSASRSGPTTITLRADGYETTSVTTELSPPQTVDVEMQTVTKPIVVTSNPDGATVLVDGTEVGTTPWAGEYWVGEEVDIEIRKSGYVYQSYTDVSPEAGIHAELVSLTTVIGDSPLGLPGRNDTTTSTPTPTVQTDVTSFDSFDGSSVVTGTESFDYAGYLDTTLTEVPLLESPVTASFTTGPTTPVGTEPVTFDATDSYALTSSIDSYEWSFGDGTTATGETATHQYAGPGTYDVSLTVVTENGTVATTTEKLTVDDRAPTSRFQVDPARPVAGAAVTLDASAATDPEGALTRYEWRLGDGKTLTGRQVTHTYAGPGSYDVELTVVDANGKTDTTVRSVRVSQPNEPPTATFEADATEVPVGEPVTFDASASGDDGTVQVYGWNFDDGNVASGDTVTHEFEAAGTYEVTLTILDDRFERSTASQTVVVGEAGENPAATGNAQAATETATSTPAGTPVSTPGFGPVAAFLAVVLVGVLARRH